MRNTLSIVVLVLLAGAIHAQPEAARKSEDGAYLIPFASGNNQIELTVANELDGTHATIEVAPRLTPAWLTLEPATVLLEEIPAGQERLSRFSFSVEDGAPTEEAYELVFDIGSPGELLATKTIAISVELPDQLMLRGNYPNPFNAATTIGFVTPRAGDLRLEIFDAVGRQVTTMRQPNLKAGQQSIGWDASSYASGLYFYRLTFVSETEWQTRLDKMLLIK